MNSFTNNIYGADRINQSVAVLGGATAQSYGAVGLSKPSFDTEHTPITQDQVTDNLPEDQIQASPDNPVAAVKSVIDISGLFSVLNLPAGPAFDEQFDTPVFSRADTTQDSELMSRFEAAETDLSAVPGLAAVQIVGAGGGDADVDGPAANPGSTLLSFLEQVIAQAEASQAEFNDSLDGDRQSSIRDLIDNVGSDTGGTLRTTLQDGVEGRGRELVADVIDASGLRLLEPAAEPVLAVDYYGESAVLINGALDLLVQPIGSFSLPPVGPTLANAQDELAVFAS